MVYVPLASEDRSKRQEQRAKALRIGQRDWERD